MSARFKDALAATGKMSFSEVETVARISRKPMLQHIKSGHLIGEKTVIYGKMMWLFDPQDVDNYIRDLPDLLAAAVHKKANRPHRVAADHDFLRFAEIAADLGISHWTLRENWPNDIPMRRGRHGAKMMHKSYLGVLREELSQIIPRTPRQINEMEGPPPQRGRISGGPWFDVFEEVWVVMRIQPEFTAAELKRLTGATIQAARRWKSGERVPTEIYRPRLIARFREAFICRLSETLLVDAKVARLDYMKAKMRERRK